MALAGETFDICVKVAINCGIFVQENFGICVSILL